MIYIRFLLCTLLLFVGCQEKPVSPPKPSGLAYVYDGVHFVTPNEEHVESIDLVSDEILLKDVQLLLPDGFAVDPKEVNLDLLKMHGVEVSSDWEMQGKFCFNSKVYGCQLYGEVANDQMVTLSLNARRGGIEKTTGVFKLRLRGQELEYTEEINDLRKLFGQPDAVVPAYVYVPVH